MLLRCRKFPARIFACMLQRSDLSASMRSQLHRLSVVCVVRVRRHVRYRRGVGESQRRDAPRLRRCGVPGPQHVPILQRGRVPGAHRRHVARGINDPLGGDVRKQLCAAGGDRGHDRRSRVAGARGAIILANKSCQIKINQIKQIKSNQIICNTVCVCVRGRISLAGLNRRPKTLLDLI
jgi:hypothetical protein